MKISPKRSVFSSIQYGSSIATKHYTPSVIRTGEERAIAHRTNDLYAQTAKQAGKVVEVTDKVIVVEYKDGSRHSVEIGRRFGTGAGLVFPHSIVSPLKPGQTVKPGDVLSYNTNYFDPDPMDPSQVLLKTTMQAKVVLWESPDTLEDSCAISSNIAQRLEAETTKLRQIVVTFDQNVRNMVKTGTEVDYNDPLCILDESGQDVGKDLDEATLATLKKISSQAPKAKIHGIVEKIEVLYNGEMEDMSGSLQALAKASNKNIRMISKAKGENVKDGRVTNSMRIDNNELALNNAVINIYITGPERAGEGDKIVLSHQLKSVIRRVYSDPVVTEDGELIDIIFGCTSVDNRIVNSAWLIGTGSIISDEITQRAVAMYFDE